MLCLALALWVELAVPDRIGEAPSPDIEAGPGTPVVVSSAGGS